MISRRRLILNSAAIFLTGSPAFAQVTGTNSAFSMTMTANASKAAVFALWADTASWPRWDPQISTVSLTGPMRLGARGKVKGTSGPESNIEIIAYEPGVRFAYAATGPGLRIVFNRQFEQGDATRFTHSVRITGAAAGFLSGSLGRRFQQGLPAAMGRLKTMAEAATPR